MSRRRNTKNTNPATPSRRSFVKGALAASAAAVGVGYFPWNQRTYAVSKSPNEKLNIAWVGVGGKGGGDVDQAGQVGQVIAICDVDDHTLANKAEKFSDAEQFHDYRELIDKLGDKLDCVGVSTPDHNHFPASMLALKKGKHVYCQKPLTHTPWEARQLREMAAKMGVKTQMGNQGSASEGLRRGVEYMQAGTLGTIKEIHVWTDRPGTYWKQAPDYTTRPPEAPVPAYLHWDNWLGPAPVRPYGEWETKDKKGRSGAYHPFAWRGWWDFGTGALGDMACHLTNMAFHGANLKYPTSVVAESGELNPETYPGWARIVLDFPGIKFHWYEGNRDGKLVQPDHALFTGVEFDDKHKLPIGGALIVGDKGSMFQTDDYGGSWKLLPEKDFKDVKDPPQTLKRHTGDNDLAMKQEWAAAIRGEIDKAYSDFSYAGVLTEAMLLGNIAIRMKGQKLDWDGEGLKFTNNEEANKYVRLPARSGWDVTA